MKVKLMIQSLCPLAILTMIKNFSFITTNGQGEQLAKGQFIIENFPRILTLGICGLWTLASIIFIISFNVFKYSDKKSGYKINNIAGKEEASLDFFLTIVIPLLIDNGNTWQGFMLFVAILVAICLLLWNTKFFYSNPMLSILGYHTYEISFVENRDKPKNAYIAICHGRIQEDCYIEYKDITKDVLYIKEMK